MSSFEELAEAVKLRELSPEEVKYILQKVKELTNSHDKDLPNWIHLLSFVKEYQSYEVLFSAEEYDKMVQRTIEDFHLLATYCPDLESIRLEMPDDKPLAFLDLFPRLLRFRIDSGSCITENGMEHVWKLSQLTHLTLENYNDVYDVFIEKLCQLDKLTDLNLDGCDYVFNHNLEQIAKLKNLRSLNLGASVRVNDEGVPYIAKMKNLVCLNLGGTRISDGGILVLSTLPKLKEFWIRRCNITDEGLKNLASFQHLEIVVLSDCENITDAGLFYLNSIATLRMVDLSDCKNITEQGIKQLLPRIQVFEVVKKNQGIYVFSQFPLLQSS